MPALSLSNTEGSAAHTVITVSVSDLDSPGVFEAGITAGDDVQLVLCHLQFLVKPDGNRYRPIVRPLRQANTAAASGAGRQRQIAAIERPASV